MDNDVCLLASFQRADQVAFADRAGAVDGGQTQPVVCGDAHWVASPITHQADQQRGGAQDVHRIAGIFRVATEGQSGTAGDQFAMSRGRGEALGQTQVGPWARRNRGVGVDDDVQFFIVQMHAMRDQHVGAECAKVLQVNERTPAGSLQVTHRITAVRGHVEREPHVALAGEFAGACHQFVAHQIVTNQCDPALDEISGWQAVEQRGMPFQHYFGGPTEWHALCVPTPLSDRGSHANVAHACSHAVGVGDGAGFDRGRNAVGYCLDRCERGRQLVVVGGVLAMDRHRPVVDRILRIDRIGDARMHQPVAGEVLMSVDITRGDQRRCVSDHLCLRMRGPQRRPVTHGGDQRCAHRDSAVGDNGALRIHRHNLAAHQYVHLQRLPHHV